jgi:2-keto-4-pentenoate hydratase/2-oxohepta-3-ene-1,7-dioic acid hydratase in catechol pathway
MNLALPDHPTLFFKPSTCLGAPNAPLVIPHLGTDGQADYEAELAIIIGRTAKNVKKEDAMGYVLSYACSNDVTARVHQFNGAQWGFGKGFDGFAPLAHCVVSAASVTYPGDIELKTVLNGETMQYSLTRDCGVSESSYDAGSWSCHHNGHAIWNWCEQGTESIPQARR